MERPASNRQPYSHIVHWIMFSCEASSKDDQRSGLAPGHHRTASLIVALSRVLHRMHSIEGIPRHKRFEIKMERPLTLRCGFGPGCFYHLPLNVAQVLGNSDVGRLQSSTCRILRFRPTSRNLFESHVVEKASVFVPLQRPRMWLLPRSFYVLYHVNLDKPRGIRVQCTCFFTCFARSFHGLCFKNVRELIFLLLESECLHSHHKAISALDHVLGAFAAYKRAVPIKEEALPSTGVLPSA